MVKQAIIVRMDLNMPQVAHAALAIVLDMGSWKDDVFTLTPQNEDVKYWLRESFTKVVLKAYSEKELDDLATKAKDMGLPFAMISDPVNGKIEKTALAIGPADGDYLSRITCHMSLL